MDWVREGTAWVVSVDMGYGHTRAALPLMPLAYGGKIIAANAYDGIPESDRTIWNAEEKSYTFLSRFSQKGMIGETLFFLFDSFQKVHRYRPSKKEYDPSLQLRAIHFEIQRGWGSDLIRRLGAHPVPILTTFFIVAHMAEYWGYPGKIYVIVTDSDISRAWAPYRPEKSSIRYFVPTLRAMNRLISYGVSPDHIFYTGFPLPSSLIGIRSGIAKRRLVARIARLDPLHHYRDRYRALITFYLTGIGGSSTYAFDPPKILFSIGGAGAQTAIAEDALASLADFIRRKKMTLRLAAGVSESVAETFRRAVSKAGLADCLGTSISILSAPTKEEYFEKFNEALASSDVLWTKPSELSFYAALGVPIIIAPPLGSHEIQNKEWLRDLGAGVPQGDPRRAIEWLPNLIESGKLASCAMQGFIEIERMGAENIAKIIN